MMAYALLGVGLVLLVLGSETVLRGSVRVSAALGLSPLIIGLLIVSAGTSSPELVVAISAAMHNAPDIALGNIIGSNIVNALLMVGLGALVRPLPSSPKVVWRDGLTMLVASVALVVMAMSGMITRQMGWLLLAAFAVYVVISFFTDWRRPSHMSVAETRAIKMLGEQRMAPSFSFFLMLFGFVCLYFGGRFAVDGGLLLAQEYHVPQALIGLTVIAFGASLPELTTTLIATGRGQTSIAIGHLIGSNIFNLLLVLGIAASIHPLSVAPSLAHFDVFVMLASAALLIPMMASGWRVTRSEGFVLVLLYVGYIGYLAWQQGYLHLAKLGLG
ncbi:MAG: calcium/sodium antiporter [Proteobacteria bacterium]|nr:calcium/sodium antiporter [Pseudomonadota bacterium]